MQADVILKEPPPWVPPFSLSGGARVEGGGPPPLVRPWWQPLTFLDFLFLSMVYSIGLPKLQRKFEFLQQTKEF